MLFILALLGYFGSFLFHVTHWVILTKWLYLCHTWIFKNVKSYFCIFTLLNNHRRKKYFVFTIFSFFLLNCSIGSVFWTYNNLQLICFTSTIDHLYIYNWSVFVYFNYNWSVFCIRYLQLIRFMSSIDPFHIFNWSVWSVYVIPHYIIKSWNQNYLLNFEIIIKFMIHHWYLENKNTSLKSSWIHSIGQPKFIKLLLQNLTPGLFYFLKNFLQKIYFSNFLASRGPFSGNQN